MGEMSAAMASLALEDMVVKIIAKIFNASQLSPCFLHPDIAQQVKHYTTWVRTFLSWTLICASPHPFVMSPFHPAPGLWINF